MAVTKPMDTQEDDTQTQVLSEAEGAALLSDDSGKDFVFPPGTMIGEYELEAEIGAGGGGSVYAARHSHTGRRVALKVLRPEMVQIPGMITRFMREVEAVNTIKHPNIIEIFDVGELSGGAPYYAMELLEGMDLQQLLALHTRLSPREMLSILEPVFEAIHAAHVQDIIHRDIKANNIFVSDTGGVRRVKLLDFGIAKMLQGEANGQGLTQPGAWIGTPQNMAPEQVRCEKLDARADVYALGVLIFQLLTGKFPFRGDPREIALKHLQAPAPRPSQFANVSPALDEIVLKCLAKKAADRYQSVPEIVEALRGAILAEEAPAAEVEKVSTTTIGIYFEIEAGSGDEEDLDDEVIEDVANVLDIIEGELGAYDFRFPLHTSTALLGIHVPTDGSAPMTVAEGTDLAQDIRAILDEREDAHPDVQVTVSIREGSVWCKGDGPASEVVGGPLLHVKEWPNHSRVR